MPRLPWTALIALFTTTAIARSCGLNLASCPTSQICIPLDKDCSDLHVCLGTCVTPITHMVERQTTYQTCTRGRPCAENYDCVDDPRSGCRMASRECGICISQQTPTCDYGSGAACGKREGLACYRRRDRSCNPEDDYCQGLCLYPLK